MSVSGGSTTQGGMNGTTQTVTALVSGYADLALQLTGTFSATIQFEATVDNQNWVALAVTPSAGGSDVTSATAPGLWTAIVGGYYAVRTRCSAYTSGIAYASLNASTSTIAASAVVVDEGLSGIGTLGDPVNVNVDGTSIGINGSNELEVLTEIPAIDATFLTATDETGTLTGSRQLLAGTNITFDDTTPGERTVNASGGGSLPLQVAADGDPVLLNHAGDTILGTSATGGLTAPVLDLLGNGTFGPVADDPLIGGGIRGTKSTGFRARNDADDDDINLISIGEEPDLVYVADNAASGVTAFSLWEFLNPVSIPATGRAASLTTDLGVPNADLTWTATGVGQGGNATQIAYVADVSVSATYVAPLLTITFIDGVTTAQDVIDEGVDGAPVSATTAPGNDGSGVVVALSATNLSGGLSALNVTGPSSLDNGAITTNGLGRVTAGNDGTNGGSFYAASNDGTTIVRFTDTGIEFVGSATDGSISIDPKGAGTINLNSDTVASGNVDSQTYSVDGTAGITGDASLTDVLHFQNGLYIGKN